MDTTTKTMSNRQQSGLAARRQRSVAEKWRIGEETLKPRTSVSVTARAHDINANLVFDWRRLYHAGPLDVTSRRPVLVKSPPALPGRGVLPDRDKTTSLGHVR